MKVLLTADEISVEVGRLAEKIAADYANRPLTIIGVLTGSLVLMADLIRLLDLPLRVGVVQASSYRGASTTRGPLVINSELMPDIRDRDVLLVDDIFDTGHTLVEVMARMDELGPRTVKSAVLLLKHGRAEVKTRPDYVAFDIPNEFVVGYGLDYQDEYRHLPYIAALGPEELPEPSK